MIDPDTEFLIWALKAVAAMTLIGVYTVVSINNAYKDCIEDGDDDA